LKLALLSHGMPVRGDLLDQAALGGSETALVQMAAALARLGHEVRVFANCPWPGPYGGVVYQDLSQWPAFSREQDLDVVLVSRFYELFDRIQPGRLRVLWLHDVLDRPQGLAPRLEAIDLIFCLSRFHLEDTARRLPAAGGRLVLTRNGLDLDLIEAVRAEGLSRRLNRAVYASRPERGLEGLLSRIWPAVRRALPGMELVICGYPVDQSGWPEDLAEDYARLREAALASPGVSLAGGLAKPEFYRLLASSGFLLYPCTFAEISCLAALEAQALDLPVLTSDRFALQESVVEPAFKVAGRPGSAEYFEGFLARFLDLAGEGPATLDLARRAGQAVRSRHDWDLVAREWTELFRERLRAGPALAEKADRTEAGPAWTGASFEEVSRRALAQRHPRAAEALDRTGGPAEAALVEGPKGRALIKAREGVGAWRALHGAVDPRAEAERLAESLDLSQAGLVVVLGFGLGLHLEAIARHLPAGVGLVVIEPVGRVIEAAARARDLSALLSRPGLKLIVEPDPDLALGELARLQLAAGLPRIKSLVHQPSLRAMPRSYGLLAEGLGRVEKVRLEDKLTYPKFTSDRVRVLVLHAKYFLMGELSHGFEDLGHQMRLILIRDRELAAQEVIRNLVQNIVEFRPDFLLTINHLGFDRDGVLTRFLGQIRLPFASWYVDSPLLIIRHYQENRSPWGTIFLWDGDYLPEMKALGYENVFYLPLAADERTFRPYAAGELNGRERLDLAFVGNSMRQAIARKWRELNLPQEVGPLVDEAARLFTASPERSPGPFLAQAGLRDHPALDGFDQARLIDLEALVVWRATQLYRLGCVQALAGLGPTVVGDEGWSELLDGRDFDLRPPVNYYEDLPALYNLTEINFNATSLQMKTGLNQRVFDVPACGRFLLTDYRAQMEELFRPGRESAAYRSPEEAGDLAAYFLAHPDERARVAAAANERVRAEHTYGRRLTTLIETMRRIYRAETWSGRQV